LRQGRVIGRAVGRVSSTPVRGKARNGASKGNSSRLSKMSFTNFDHGSEHFQKCLGKSRNALAIATKSKQSKEKYIVNWSFKDGIETKKSGSL
jgi:hypothetical protein